MKENKMSRKRFYSLILSILMLVQVFVMPVQAQKQGYEDKTISQSSDGKYINGKTQIFKFENKNKNADRGLFGRFRLMSNPSSGAIRTEKANISTLTFGLDNTEPTFDWGAFGNSKSFEAWIYVQYEGDDDFTKASDPIKIDEQHKKISDVEVRVNTNRTVKYYAIFTQYDTDDTERFNIRAEFDQATQISAGRPLNFELIAVEMVSTKIQYEYIDEYKIVTTEDKPVTNLAKLYDFGEDKGLDAKTEGETILFRDIEGKTAYDYQDKNVKLALKKQEFEENGIKYLVKSDYNYKTGGKITIQRQKNVIVPPYKADFSGPEDTPQGYKRLTFDAFEKADGTGIQGTHIDGKYAGNRKSYIDVKNDVKYDNKDLKDEINKLNVKGTKDGKDYVQHNTKPWNPDVPTTGEVKDKTTYNARYKKSTEDIIPFIPADNTHPTNPRDDNVPKVDKDNNPIDLVEYDVVAFKTEDANRGVLELNIKKPNNIKAEVQKVEYYSALVKKADFRETKKALTFGEFKAAAKLNEVPKADHKFWFWDEKAAPKNKVLDEKVLENEQVYTAHFIKDGQDITNEDLNKTPLPNDTFKVEVKKDNTIKANALYDKSYAVFKDSKLAKAKFPTPVAEEKYSNPGWKSEAVKVEEPWNQKITADTTFTATATKSTAEEINAAGGLKAVDIKVLVNTPMGEKFWNDGVALADNFTGDEAKYKALLAKAKVEDLSDRTTAKAEEQQGNLLVTFEDGSTIKVDNQKLYVLSKDVKVNFDEKANDDANAPRHKETVVKGNVVAADKSIVLEGSVVTVKDAQGKVLGKTLANADGSFVVGTNRKLEAGEKLKIEVKLKDAKDAADAVKKTVKLNPDELNKIITTGEKLYNNLKEKPGVSKSKLDDLTKAVKAGYGLVDKADNPDEQINQKAKATDQTKAEQDKLDNAYKAIKAAIEALTENKLPTITGPDYKEIFVGKDLDLTEGIEVKDGDGDNDIVMNGADKFTYTVKRVEASGETDVSDIANIKNNVGTYKVTYTAKDQAGATATHTMEVVVKEIEVTKIEVTTDPTNEQKYLVRTEDGKAAPDYTGMEVKITKNDGSTETAVYDANSKTFKIGTKTIDELTVEPKEVGIADSPAVITATLKDGDKTFTARANKAIIVQLDKDGNGKADIGENFEIEKAKTMEIVNQPKLEYEIDQKTGKATLDLKPLVVKVTDTLGNFKYFGYEDIKGDNKFALAFGDEALDKTTAKDITVADTNKNVKVTLTYKDDKTLEAESKGITVKDNRPDVIENPKDGETPVGYFKVEFKAGDHGGLKGTSLFFVKEGKTLSSTSAPTIVPEAGYKVKAEYNGWDKEIPQAIDKAFEATAQYKEDDAISETPKPGYTAITFDALDKGKIGDARTKTIYVNPAVAVKLTAPTVTPNAGYEFKAWDPSVAEEKIYKNNQIIIATYNTLADVSETEVKGYNKVTFKSGDKGNFGPDAQSALITEKSVWIKPNTLVDLSKYAPKVTVTADGYSHIGWDKNLVGKFENNDVITAKYSNKVSDTYVPGWTLITFSPGEHGDLANNAKNVIWVDPTVEFELKDIAPTLVEHTNWTFKTWNNGVQSGDKALDYKAKYTQTTKYRAIYESVFSDTAKTGFVKITFKEGEHGKFAQNSVKEIYVKEKVLVDLREKAPVVEPFQGYGHTGWDTNLVGKFDGAKEITAQYTKGTFDKDGIENIIVLGPTQMGYGEGEKLNLAGLKVIAIDKAGIQETYDGVDAIKAAGFDIAPANETPLTIKDHDGKAIVVKKGQLEGQTTTTLKIHENKSAKAENVKALNQNKVGQDGNPTDKAKPTTTVTGKVKPGSKVVIQDETGKDITPQVGVTVNPDGSFTAEVTKQEDGKKVKVIVTEKGKQPSDPAEATVARDANNDGNADNQADQKTKTPTAKALNMGKNPTFTTITGKTEAGAKVVAKVGDVKVGEATADGNGEYKIEANKDNAALPKDTEVKVTAQADKKLVSDQAATIVRIDKDGNGTADNEEGFDITKLEKLEIVKQPQLDYIAKDKSEDSKFKLNLDGMVIRMTDKADKQKLVRVKGGKFVDYDDDTKEITELSANPAHGAALTPQTSEGQPGDNGKTVRITSTNGKTVDTDPLKVFYDANGDKTPDYKDGQKTQAPSIMARNVGENPDKTTVEGLASPGAVIKFTTENGTPLTTEPKEVKAGPDGKYTATISPKLADGTKIKATAKLGEMEESEPAETTVFDDKNNNKQADKDEGFNITKATDIAFSEEPDLTYLVEKKEDLVTFDGKDAKGKQIYLKLSYKDGNDTVERIMTLEELMKDTEHISVTPANGTKDKIGNAQANLVGKKLEVKLVKADKTATSANAFDIKVDADKNGKADEDEVTPTPSILSARNIKDGDKVETKVLVKGEPGAVITIKSADGTKDLGTGVVEANGEVEITLTAKQDAGTKIQAIAKLGDKKPSNPAESIVFDDLDGDGKPDGQGKVDFDNIVDMRIASDPKTMSYAVKTDSEETALKLEGLTVYVKDKNGNTGIYQYGAAANKVNNIEFKELKNNTEFKLELVDSQNQATAIAADTKLAKANDANKIKVSLVKNKDKNDTTGPLNVFVDANGNGVDDDKEKIDLTKVKSIKVISQPELNYPIKVADNGKKNIDLTKMVVSVSDGVTTANYTAQELLDAKVGEDKAFKLELVQGSAKAAPTTKDITSVNGIELTTANDGNKVQISKASDANVKTETEALEVFEDLDGDGKRDEKQTPAPKDLKALNVKDDAFTTITGKAKKGDTLKVYGEDKKEITVDPSNIKIDDDGNFTIKVAKNDAALPEGTTVFVTAQAEGKDESSRIPVIVQVDKDGNGTADKDERTTIKSVIARNIGTGEPKVPATFTTIEGKAEAGSTVTIKFTEKGKATQTIKEVTADATTGEYKLKLDNPAILLDKDTEVLAKAKYEGKQDSEEISTKVFEDLNADGKDDNATSQKTATPTAKALNVKEDAFTTITGKAEAGATVVAKVDDVKVGEAKADAQTGEYTIKATKENAALAKDTEVQVTAQADGKLVSDATATIVKIDKDGNGKADNEEDFDIKKVTSVEVLQDPTKMDYLVTTKDGTTPFKTAGLVIKLTDSTGKEVKYTADEIKTVQGITVEPADNESIGLNKNNTKLKVTVTGSDLDTKPSAESKKNITVKLDADGNGIADEDEQTPEPNVIARNIGKDPQKTTVEVKTEPNADVTIEYKDANDEIQKIVAKADGEGKLTKEITPMLKDGTDVKVTVKDGEKKPAEKTVKVFDDLDDDKKPDTEAGQTERPAAIASNIGKTPAFTTITGEGEKGATITAKVGNEVVGTATVDATGKYTIQAKKDDKALAEGTKIAVTATKAPKTESLPQNVVVFKDTDGTGQPDSAKDFDIKKAVDMEVVASPNKMEYTDGDALNLDGLKVLVKDENGNQKIFTYNHANNAEFTNAGLTTDLAQDAVLSAKDYDANTTPLGHNGRKIKVTLTLANTGTATNEFNGETPTALTVKQVQTAKVTDVVAANQGNDAVTKVRFKAVDDATIKIYKADDANKANLIDGKPVAGTGKDAGYLIATLKEKLPEGTWIEITAKQEDKLESSPEQAQVIRDKNSKWEAGKSVSLTAPVIDPIREHDEKVTITAPKADDKIQTIEVSDGTKTVTLTKDATDTEGKTWKVVGSDQAEKVTEKDGKLEIPVNGTLPLNDRDQIKVTFKDGETPANEVFDRQTVKPASKQPTVDQVYTGDTEVKIADPTVADPTATTINVKVGNTDPITVTKDNNSNKWMVNGQEADVKDGKVIVPIAAAVKGTEIKVTTTNDSGNPSPEATVKVEDKENSTKPEVKPVSNSATKITGTAGPNADVVITITSKNDGAVKEIAGKADKDGNFTVPVEGLNDGDTIVAKATEKDKAEATSDPVTVGVDTTELDKAIQEGKDSLDKEKGGKNEGTKADKDLEAAITEGENLKKRTQPSTPTQQELKDATEKIKKAIEEKKKTDKELDRLKEAQGELEKSIKDAEKERKPKEDIKKAKETNEEAKNTIKNKDKGSEAIKELIKKVEEQTKQMRKPVVMIDVTRAIVNENKLLFKTNPGNCKVTITIYHENGTETKLTSETGPEGTGSIELAVPLAPNDFIDFDAKDSKGRYLDGYTPKSI